MTQTQLQYTTIPQIRGKTTTHKPVWFDDHNRRQQSRGHCTTDQPHSRLGGGLDCCDSYLCFSSVALCFVLHAAACEQWQRQTDLADGNSLLHLCFAGFSAQPLYTSSLIATFNVVWTSWPTIGFAVLEQVSLLLPEHLYTKPVL